MKWHEQFISAKTFVRNESFVLLAAFQLRQKLNNMKFYKGFFSKSVDFYGTWELLLFLKLQKNSSGSENFKRANTPSNFLWITPHAFSSFRKLKKSTRKATPLGWEANFQNLGKWKKWSQRNWKFVIHVNSLFNTNWTSFLRIKLLMHASQGH